MMFKGTSDTGTFDTDYGEYAVTNDNVNGVLGTWTGNRSSVVFYASSTARIKQIYVEYGGSAPATEYNIYRTITAQNPNDQGGWLGDWSGCSTVGEATSATGYEVKALNGSEVIFTAGANRGYEILSENITIKDADENNVTCTFVSTDDDGNKRFKFTMPASNVTISAYFTFYRPTLRLAGRFNGRDQYAWITDDSGPAFTYSYKDENNTVVDHYTLDVYFSNSESLNFFWFRQDGNDLKAAGTSNEGDYGLNEGNLNITHSLGGERNFQIIPGLYTFTINGDRNQLSITRITPTITFKPAAGTVAPGTKVSATSTLTSIINAIKVADTGAEGTVSVQVSTDDGNTFTDDVTLNESATVTGKASIGNIVATATANYTVAPYYNITCSVVTDPSDKTGGTITADKQTAPAGETVTLTITTKVGYDFDGVKVNGTTITGNTFEMPAADANVIAYFTAKTLNITVNNDDAKGVVSGIPATSTVGSKIEFTVTPHTGYTFNSVTYTFTPDGGNPNTQTVNEEDGEYYFFMPGYDVTVDVSYDEVIEGLINPLFHETFGNNEGKARTWDDSYSVKTGVEAVYENTSYSVSNAKQCKNTVGYDLSGLISSTNSEGGLLGSIIMGPLNVANYQSLQLTYYWKTGSTGATFNTKAYYGTSAEGTDTEVNGSGPNANTQTYVLRTYNLPAAAEVSNLYLKIEFYTSNGNAYIDEVNLSGSPKRTTLKQIEETNPTGEVTIADDLQVVAIVDKEIDENTTIQVAFARDFAESINPASCPEGAVDFMRNMVYTEADKQVGEWQQNNWVMLRFPASIATETWGQIQPNCVIKGGTLTGTYNNYTFEVSEDFEYEAGPAVGDYTPNVYSPANFHNSNTQTLNGKDYWFMTPKPMEVCKFTWAMYYDKDGYDAGFYMQDGDVPLKGGVGVDMSYNSGIDDNDLVNGESYRFTGVIMKVMTGKKEDPDPTDPDNHYPQEGSVLNRNFKVAAVNLDPTDENGQIVTGVSEVKTGGEVVSVTYCDLAGRMSQKPFAGVNIIVTRYSDGTVKTTKAIK